MNANVHRRTPALSVIDGRGLPVRQIAYLRSGAEDAPTSLVSRRQHDAAGRAIAQWDPRLSAPNLATVYNLAGAALNIDSVDAGWRVSLLGRAGQALERWDARGSHWRMTHDDLLRVVTVEENAVADYEVFTYAGATADAGRNLRGQLIALRDASGGMDFHSYSLLGQALDETRTFHDAEVYTSRRVHGPQGNVLEHTDAGGHRQQSSFDLAGQLKHVKLRLNGQSAWQPILQTAQYNASGQIIEQQAGNGVISRWVYDPANGTLQRQTAHKAAEALLQDFEYTYDPVGNIRRIVDHTFIPSHFANQRVDGDRQFSYDSLYRLVQASGYDDGPPVDSPGLPHPTDPADRRNYTRRYAYDAGGNLIETVHVRDGASHTLRLFIDPASNKGVRWKAGDPLPDFNTRFDANGNQRLLQPGQDMHWNATDELEQVMLVKRPGAVDDAEHYRYSQGTRVHKRLETATGHFHDVRYLPGLEIRRKDSGEELHVISLAAGAGNVRCLHWLTGKPAGIDADQLRYSLEDHLGSNLMELDQQARMISHEGYYPFGATAWMAARSVVEADYKTVRYSGKEMDVSGLYYYGARYYAPWLQRWISADPAGDVDGLNLYGFVGNNPVRYVDVQGTAKAEQVIFNYARFSGSLSSIARVTSEQLDNVIHQQNVALEMFKNFVGEAVNGGANFAFGYILGGRSALDGSAVLSSQPFADGLTVGNASGDAVSGVSDAFVSGSFSRPLIPQTSKISVAAIDKMLGVNAERDIKWNELPDKFINPEFFATRIVGSFIGIIGNAMNLGSRAQEAEDINNRLDPVKINKIDMMLVEWKSAVEDRWAEAEKAFDALGSDVMYPATLMPNVNAMTPREAIAPIHRAALAQQTRVTLDLIGRMQKGMTWYKETGTTDNQWILKNPRVAAYRGLKLQVSS